MTTALLLQLLAARDRTHCLLPLPPARCQCCRLPSVGQLDLLPTADAMADAAAGVLEMTIWLKGRDVYLLMICTDYKAATAYLDKQPKSLEWEEWMAPMMETGEGDEYDPANAYPDGLPEVFRWEATPAGPAAGGLGKRPALPAEKLALYYIPVRARAENIRMMLAFAGVEYDDHVVPMDEWRAEGGLKGKMPFGQLPAIELPGGPPGRYIAQSGSCTRAVAKLCGLCPADPNEEAFQDSLFEAGQELSSINPVCNVFSGDTLAAKKAEFFSDFPTKRDNLAKQLVATPGAFFGGERPMCEHEHE
jgi:L-rhamnose mutarotase